MLHASASVASALVCFVFVIVLSFFVGLVQLIVVVAAYAARISVRSSTAMIRRPHKNCWVCVVIVWLSCWGLVVG